MSVDAVEGIDRGAMEVPLPIRLGLASVEASCDSQKGREYCFRRIDGFGSGGGIWYLCFCKIEEYAYIGSVRED